MATHASMDVDWRSPPAQPGLSHDQVHVWRARLDVSGAELALLRDTLAQDELDRAQRFHFPRDRDRYIAAHGALRVILGSYLGIAPNRVQFDPATSPHGKPRLKQPTARGQAVFFNISHSHELALYAVACGRDVGVDVEYVRPNLAEGRIAERFFAPGEVASLRGLPAHEQPLAFFNCWTRKEAFVKARGEGLSLPLDRFEVSLAPGQPPALLRVVDAPDEAARWSLHAFAPAAGYVAALVVEGRGWRLSAYDWQYPGGNH